MSNEEQSIPYGLLAAFGLDEGTSHHVEVLGGGHIHRTLRVTTASNDVVAQAVNRNVFADLDACEDNLSRIDRHVGALAQIAIPRLRRTSDDRVHWIDGDGDGEWAIALRCAQFEAEPVAGASGALDRLPVTAHAGAGIVAGSDPESELIETRVKFRPIVDALA